MLLLVKLQARKDFLRYMCHLKKSLRFFFLIGFTLFSVIQCSLSSLWVPPSALHTLFDTVSSNKDKDLLVNRTANVFAFGEFNFHC